MKCHDVRKMLVVYLDNEAAPLEQKQVRDHLAGCADCRAEMSSLAGLQSHLHRSLKIEAAQVAPSPDAWRRLQARLANEPASPPARGNGWLHRLALLGTNRREADRKNRPVSDASQGWSPDADPTARQRWHSGLVWAAKWPKKAIGRSSKKPFTINNKQTQNDKPDRSAE